ncbi:MAG: hypothetical protein JNN27_00475 [Planctomycetes bacterium]|nr:hypothetical protein [Planctomycetota bacterium]
MTPLVTSVRFLHASALDRQQGLLGWAEFTLHGQLRISGSTVRRTRGGRVRAFGPERIDRLGRLHRVVDVLDAELEREIEEQLLVALKAQGVLP